MKNRILHRVLSLLLVLTLVFPATTARAATALTASEDCVAILKRVEGFSKYPVAAGCYPAAPNGDMPQES